MKRFTIKDSTAIRIAAAVVTLGTLFIILTYSGFVYNIAYEDGLECGRMGFESFPNSRVSQWHNGQPDTTYRDGYQVVTKVDTILTWDFARQCGSGQTTIGSTVGAFPDSTFSFTGGLVLYNIRTYVDSVACYNNATESFISSSGANHAGSRGVFAQDAKR